MNHDIAGGQETSYKLPNTFWITPPTKPPNAWQSWYVAWRPRKCAATPSTPCRPDRPTLQPDPQLNATRSSHCELAISEGFPGLVALAFEVQLSTRAEPTVLVAAITLTIVTLAACGSSAAPGDPGNKRLDQLSADPIFAELPSGAELIGHMEKTPAKWQDNGWFEPSSWNGPAVRITFVDSDAPDAAFSFYANLATTSGWVSNGNTKDGYPVAWTKKFPSGWEGSLGLIDISSSRAKPGQAHTFILNASCPAAS